MDSVTRGPDLRLLGENVGCIEKKGRGGGSVNNFQPGISPEDTAGRKKARRGG